MTGSHKSQYDLRASPNRHVISVPQPTLQSSLHLLDRYHPSREASHLGSSERHPSMAASPVMAFEAIRHRENPEDDPQLLVRNRLQSHGWSDIGRVR